MVDLYVTATCAAGIGCRVVFNPHAMEDHVKNKAGRSKMGVYKFKVYTG